MRKFLVLAFLTASILSCNDKEKRATKTESKPHISENGRQITFMDSKNLSFIKTEKIGNSSVQSEMVFPARVAATSVPSQEGAGRNIILFDDPELTANYTSLMQHLINISQLQNITIKQRTIELDRAKDLAANGAATGRDVLEAETALAIEKSKLNNEQASLIEHEARIKLAGFDPEALLKATAGKIWVICDIPESLLNQIQVGNTCTVQFSSYPEEKFSGSIVGIADVVSSSTRMIKVRLLVKNTAAKMKAGMFASVSFDQVVANAIAVPKQSLVIVQGKIYVFVKTGAMQFERREITVSSLVNDWALVSSGVKVDEEVVTQGAMQLKGLSFGY